MSKPQPPLMQDEDAIVDAGPWHRAVEIVGPEGAALLSRDFAGRRLYIPAAPGPDHPLSVCLGHPLATELAKALVGSYLDAPLTAGRRLRILTLLAQGEKPERISRIVGCSRSYVFKLQAEERDRQAKADQGDLF